MPVKNLSLGLCVVALLVTGLVSCTKDTPPKADRARPVTRYVITSNTPVRPGRLMGVVEPFREESVGFAVAGRVEFVAHVGTEHTGSVFDHRGKEIADLAGDEIGRLDATRYEQEHEAARLRLEANKKGLEAQQIELQSLMTAELNGAKAEDAAAEAEVEAAESTRGMANTTFLRKKELLDNAAISREEYDEAETTLKEKSAALESKKQRREGTRAGIASVNAKTELKRAEIERTRAEIAELEQKVVQARQDVTDCTLRSPFSGRITSKAVGRGGYVQVGTPVVTLTMMDPIKVSVTMSADDSRDLEPGSRVELYPTDLGELTGREALQALVDNKSEVADANTRTFRIDLLVRNLRIKTSNSADSGDAMLIDQVFPVLKRLEGGSGPLFVFAPCFMESGTGQAVYRIPALQLRDGRTNDMDRVFKPERVEVKRGKTYLPMVQHNLIDIAEGSGLEEWDMLVANPTPEISKGIRIARREWVLRPGDLVPVSLDATQPPPGFYVPVEAIRTLNGQASVFVIKDSRVSRVAVTVHETAGGTRRIASPDLAPGTEIAVEGVHYLADGESVSIVETAPWVKNAASGEGR